MKNEIQKTQSNPLLTAHAQSEVVLNKDTIQLPRLVLVSPLSSFKKEHEALKDGEIVSSDDFSVIVPKKSQKKFIPLLIKQFFDTYEITSAGKNLISREKYTGQETDYDDPKIVKTVVFETLFLSRENTQALPYIVTFRHGSIVTGKKLMTMMYVTNKQFKKSPWAAGVTLFSTSRKNKDGKEFEIIDFKTDPTPLTEKELSDAENWVASFMGAKIEASEVVE
jgi:hypothetical protein